MRPKIEALHSRWNGRAGFLRRLNGQAPPCPLELGRVIRDIRRKTEDGERLREIFAMPLSRAERMRSQRQRGGKLYSLHAPEVECIGILYDGHTVGAVLRETEALIGIEVEQIYVDKSPPRA